MLARVFILSLTIPHLLWAKVSCDELNAVHKIEAYRTCQTTWTAGICGLALGHLTASALKDATRNALLKIAKENSDALARDAWDAMRHKVLEEFLETEQQLVKEISNLQEEHYFKKDTLEALNANSDEFFQDTVSKTELEFFKKTDQTLYEKLVAYKLEASKMNPFVDSYMDDPDSKSLLKLFNLAMKRKRKLSKKNKSIIKKAQKLLEEKIKEDILSLNEKIETAKAKYYSFNKIPPRVKLGIREIDAISIYSDLQPNIQKQISDYAQQGMETVLKTGNPTSVKRSVNSLVNALNGKTVAQYIPMRFPKLAAFAASKHITKLALLSTGVLGAIDLFASTTDSAGCGGDVLNKNYVNFDPDTCQKKNEISQNNLNFLNLSEKEQLELMKKDWGLQRHYENICNSIFNDFEIKNFTCEGSKINIDTTYFDNPLKQELHIKNGVITDFILSPGLDVETVYKLDKNGDILSYESPTFRKRQADLMRYSKALTTRQGELDAREIIKQTEFWGSRFIIYADDIKSCCNEKDQAFVECKRNILNIYSKNKSDSNPSGIQ